MASQTQQIEQSDGFTDEQRTALEDAFDQIDVDDSGTISRSELRAALQIIGQNPTVEEMDSYFEGSSKKGEFTKDEYLDFVKSHVPLKTEAQIDDELLKAFAKFDTNQDLYISKEEFIQFMTSMGEEPLTPSDMDTLFNNLNTVEKDEDKLNVEELAKLFMGLLEEDQSSDKPTRTDKSFFIFQDCPRGPVRRQAY